MNAAYHRRILFDLLDGRATADDLQSLDVNWEAVEYHLDKYLSYVKRPSNSKLWHMFGKLLFGFGRADCIDEFGAEFVADVISAIRVESEKHYRRRALNDVQVFYVEAEEFLDRNTWMFDRLCEAAVEEGLVAHRSDVELIYNRAETDDLDDDSDDGDAYREQLSQLNGLSMDLSGWYFWCCRSGFMPTSDATGPFPSEEEAEAKAVQLYGDYGYTEDR